MSVKQTLKNLGNKTPSTSTNFFNNPNLINTTQALTAGDPDLTGATFIGLSTAGTISGMTVGGATVAEAIPTAIASAVGITLGATALTIAAAATAGLCGLIAGWALYKWQKNRNKINSALVANNLTPVGTVIGNGVDMIRQQATQNLLKKQDTTGRC